MLGEGADSVERRAHCRNRATRLDLWLAQNLILEKACLLTKHLIIWSDNKEYGIKQGLRSI